MNECTDTGMLKEQEVFDPVKWFEKMGDSPFIAVIKKWVETYSPIENVNGISMRVEPLELLFDKDGVKRPLKDGYADYASSPTTEVTITLKDGSVHSATYLPTGELCKLRI